jgi:NAD(P)-dependent dehydrogenase (short-subunit alcohol dehydrogenase family)
MNRGMVDDARSPRVFLVTGANGAIGLAIARQLASQPEHEVVLVCRTAAKAGTAVAAVRKATGNPAVRGEHADLGRRAEVEALAARWRGPLHVLVNNAAAAPRRRLETPEGLEVQFATNILGYVWMMRAFAGVLGRSAPARIVNVASYWAGDLELDDLQFTRRRYDNDTAYRQSKQANRMLTVTWAERLRPAGVTVNACHPGDVPSTLARELGFGGHATPDEGAETPVWLATSDSVSAITGGWFSSRRQSRDPFAADAAALEALARACEAF